MEEIQNSEAESAVQEEQEIMSRAHDLFLDTKTVCFLCLQEDDCESANENEKFTKHSFQNISRYLGINPYSIIVKSLENGSVEYHNDVSFLKNKCKFSVLLCGECASLTNNISDMIKQIEMIKILMSHQLQVFLQILKDSDHASLWKDAKEKMMSNWSDHLDVCVVETLRNKTKVNCYSKVQKLLATNFPKVELEQLDILDETEEVFSLPIAPDVNTETVELEIEQTQRVPTPEMIEEEEPVPTPPLISTVFPSGAEPEVNITDADNEATTTADTLPIEISCESEAQNPSYNDISSLSQEDRKKMVWDICSKHFKRVNPDNCYHCTICSKTLPKNNAGIRAHIVYAHPEIFFACKKPQNLSQESFRSNCKIILSKETSIARQIMQSKTSSAINKHVYICQICNRKHTLGQYFQYHLVLEHHKIIEKMVISDQVLPPHLKTKSKRVKIKQVWKSVSNKNQQTRKKLSSKWTCNSADEDGGCGKKFSNRHSLWVHKKDYCPSRSIMAFWTCKLGSGGCGQNFGSRVLLKSHQKSKKCGKNRLQNIKNQIQQARPSRFLGVSKKLVGISVKYKDKMIEILEDLCEKVNRVGHIRKTLKNLHRCLICNRSKIAYHKSKVMKHFANVHPEVFFPHKKDPEKSDQDFISECKKMMRQKSNYVIVDSESQKGFVCSFCGLEHAAEFNFRHHLVLKHFEILEKMLENPVQPITNHLSEPAPQVETVPLDFTPNAVSHGNDHRITEQDYNEFNAFMQCPADEGVSDAVLNCAYESKASLFVEVKMVESEGDGGVTGQQNVPMQERERPQKSILKKRRGRPPKFPVKKRGPSRKNVFPPDQTTINKKRGRGRPRKIPLPTRETNQAIHATNEQEPLQSETPNHSVASEKEVNCETTLTPDQISSLATKMSTALKSINSKSDESQ